MILVAAMPHQSIPEDLSCESCNFKAVSSVGLKIHISRKHDTIPQVDGENCSPRNTDAWWEKGYKHTLKGFQMFKDVLEDIEESSLSKEEKCFEQEHITELRKKVLGSNFIYYPPWNCT